jgi:eukaryotic-like serine/threonine-protein kinase
MANVVLDEKAIFNVAREIASPEARAEYLRQACATDSNLFERVQVLLRAYEGQASFLESPPAIGVSPTIDQPVAETLGTMIGPYKLLEQIGQGGFGVVYMAEQTEPVRRKVALKILKPGMDTRQVVARFEAERQALAIMDHPNIAKVFDGGATPSGRPYFVMELVKGTPITEFCDQNHLTPRQRLELFVPVCQAVQHAHQKAIIHRDLKPSNVLVSRHDATLVVKVIDFGVAKALGQELTDKTLFTGFAQMIGTPLYMSPEQAGMSDLDIDTRSDIYSLGVLLYELLTGTTPFDKERFKKAAYDEIRRIIREEDPPKPSTRLSDSKDSLPSISAQRQTEPAKLTKLVRGELDWIVMKALEKDRNRRYETANGFAMDVQRYLADEPVQACPPSAGYRLRKFAKRNRGGLAVAALVLFFVVMLGSGVGWAMRDRSARETEAARQQGERQAKATGQVESAFAEVDRLEREQKWPEGLAAARRAEAVVAGAEADAATAERVRARLKDLEFVDRLEQVRMQAATWVGRNFDYAGADREYARSFREYGVDVEALAVETAVERLRARPALATPVAAALDDWAQVHWSLRRDGAASKRLVAVARGIDPDPLRDRLRATWGRPASEVGDEHRRLAESIDVPAEHPVTLGILAGRLQRMNHPDLAVRLLRDAQRVHPADFWLNFKLAGQLQEQKDYEGAVRFYTAAVTSRPHSDTASNNLGTALSRQGKLDEAVAACRKAIELDPKSAGAYSNLGVALSDQKKLPEAIAAYRKAIELSPNFAGAYMNLGGALAQQRKLHEAVAAFSKAIELDPNDAGAHSGLGAVLMNQKKLVEAVAAHRKSIELDPKRAASHSVLGNALAKQKKWDEAIAACRKAIELDPNDARFHGDLGVALTDQGKLGDAIAAYRKSIELDPNYANAYAGLGNALRQQKELAEAIVAYRKAIELDPKYASAYHALGIALAYQNKLDDAAVACRKAVELDPGSAAAYTDFGCVLYRQRRLGEAIAACRKAIDIDATANAYTGLGLALTEQKKWDEAIAVYRKAIEIDPTFSPAYDNLGAILCDVKKDYHGAVACSRKSIELDPNVALSHDNLGVALRGQKKLVEAVAAHRKAIELDPNYPLAHSNLGTLLCDELKEYDQAIECFRKALAIDPKNAHARRNLGIAAMKKAWDLIYSPDPKLRDSKRAIEAVKEAVELAPQLPESWQCLGWIEYRAGNWRASIETLEKSCKLQEGGRGDAGQWIVLALAHAKLAAQEGLPDKARALHKAEARRWYDQAEKEINGKWRVRPSDEFGKAIWDLRAEARELMGVKESKK